ncbi:putative F-box protein At3g10430 [Rutidosis leptorrhynchoides]|uniref:putative F-box protein At3g10430 n=1 Tax=Rutidosis leptorrhynchoides TaxID=125765 RepID=UPI003A98EB74
MSDYVPFEIQIEIFKKLPVKSLLRCRSVSKPWKSLIDSSDFVANYHFNHKQRVHVRYVDSIHKVAITATMRQYRSKAEDEKYVSIVDDDDDSFPQNEFPIVVPSDVRRLGKFPDIIGSSHGVLCLCAISREFCRAQLCKTKTFVLWNPSIRKSIRIRLVPDVLINEEFETVVGFGVCPRTSDPKLVKLTYISSSSFTKKFMRKCIPRQVELFNLSSGFWRSLSMNVPRKSIELTWEQVCVDKFIYWVAFDRTRVGHTIQKKNMILSFDMTTEEFTEIDLPSNLANLYNGCLLVSKLCTSLVVLETEYEPIREYCVWRMEHGNPNTFTKLFVIKSPFESLQIKTVHDFRKTGEPIIEMLLVNKDAQNAVFVYEPESEEISDIGIAGGGLSCLAKSYIETLVLLDK